MFYWIEETLKEVTRENLNNTDKQYVAVLTFEEWKMGYPIVIVISLMIAVGGLWFFKKKKWL